MNNATADKSNRNMGLELYKIICMFMVITFHFSDHGSIQVNSTLPLTFNWFVLAFARVWGGLCNCAFVLISGYFLCEKRFNAKRFILLWFEVWTYSVVIGIICYLMGVEQIGIKSLIKMLFPITFRSYWFISTYLILSLLAPFINILLNNIKREQHIILIVICTILFSLIPTFTFTDWLTGTNNLQIFITLYIIGAYFKKYDIKYFNSKWYFVFALLILIAEWISILICRQYYTTDIFYFVWGMHKTPVIVCSIFMFLGFKNIKIKHIALITQISSSVFGVYLIHIGRLSTFIFRNLFDNQKTYYTNYLLLQMIFSAFIIFIFSIIIDKLRIHFLEKLFVFLVKKYKIYSNIKSFINKIYSKVLLNTF